MTGEEGIWRTARVTGMHAQLQMDNSPYALPPPAARDRLPGRVGSAGALGTTAWFNQRDPNALGFSKLSERNPEEGPLSQSMSLMRSQHATWSAFRLG